MLVILWGLGLVGGLVFLGGRGDRMLVYVFVFVEGGVVFFGLKVSFCFSL